MKLTTIMSLLVSFCAAQANAAEARSEIFYQPKGGANSIELGYTMASGSYDSKTAGVKTDDTKVESSLLGLTYLYGVSDDLAVGVTLDNGSVKATNKAVGATTSTESKDSGMGDIGVEVRGHSHMDAVMLRWGGVLGFSPGNNKAAGATEDGNRYTGGMSLAPYVGVEMGDANMHYGLALRYTYRMARKSDSAGTPSVTTETTGAHTTDIMPYFEMMAGPGMLSVNLTISSTGTGTAKVAATESDVPKTSYTGLGLDYGWDATPEFTLIGSLGYAMVKRDTGVAGTENTDMNLTTFGLAGRFTF